MKSGSHYWHTTNPKSVSVSFINSDGTITAAETDHLGRYTKEVPKGWSGTLRPAKSGYVFSPEEQELTDVVSHRPLHNFEARPADESTLKKDIRKNDDIL